jgi:hypothetical protein
MVHAIETETKFPTNLEIPLGLIKTTCFFLLFCPAGKPEGMD